jgi:hypothetical protein
MAAMIKVKFHQNFWSNDDQYPMFEAGEIYDLPADYPIPTRDVEIIEGTQDIKRARNVDGTLKGDDPSTEEVNEAWEGGKAPKKKASKKKE